MILAFPYVNCRRFPTDNCFDRDHACSMTTARSLIVDSESPSLYHSISRCVRRAWLRGTNPYNGKSYEHRRQ